jgi:hypothetical protein
MPRNEIDYSKTIIYKIVCNDLTVTDCYVGSTTDFKTRKAVHKNVCNNESSKSYNLKIYKMIRDNGGWDNWVMLQIELYPCKDSNEAHARERYWYENMNAKLNTHVPNRTRDEWRDEHKEDVKEYAKEYNAKYYDDNKKEMKEEMKEYYIQNKDRIKDRKKEYYIQNKEKIAKHKSEIIICACGKTYTLTNKTRHEKSLKHREHIKNLKINDEINEPIQP